VKSSSSPYDSCSEVTPAFPLEDADIQPRPTPVSYTSSMLISPVVAPLFSI